MVADRSSQDRILGLEGVEHAPLRRAVLEVQAHLAVDACERPEVLRQDDADHARVWASIESDSEHVPPEGKLRVYRSRTGGNEWEALTNGLPQEHCYVNVLRDAMSVDTLDPGGIYFGTSGGQVYASPDAGDSWTAIVRDLPSVLSVEAQTLP